MLLVSRKVMLCYVYFGDVVRCGFAVGCGYGFGYLSRY